MWRRKLVNQTRIHSNAPSPASLRPVPKALVGQKALVTGANSGIGRAVAIALGQAGADVVVNYVVDEAAAKEVVQEIKENGTESYSYQADVSNEQDCSQCLQT
jgi:glucose 1-dehydrogenase